MKHSTFSPIGPVLVALLVPLHLALVGIAACDTDQDEDGWTQAEGDCDDQDPQSYPGAEELCDAIDNDCDGEIDDGLSLSTWYLDQDGDGSGDAASSLAACAQPEGYVAGAGDCDDAAAGVHPGATELCDAVDNDCDGQTDEEVTQTWYADPDGDGFGSADATMEGGCPGPEGYAAQRGDCDQASASVYPGAPDAEGDGVDQDCGGADGQQPSVGLPGSSYTSLQSALNAAGSGQTVWVGAGTYQEHSITFNGKVLASTAGPEATVIDARHQDRVMVFQAARSGTRVEGFTLTGGGIAGESLGGAIYAQYSTLAITGCIVTGNEAQAGGGLLLEYTTATITGCTISGNSAVNSGGGAYLDYGSDTLITDSTLSDNMSGSYGGAIHSYRHTNLNLAKCVFSRNSATSSGGAVFLNGPDDGISVAISGSKFDNNDAGTGGAITAYISYFVVSNSIFENNVATDRGGAIFQEGWTGIRSNCLCLGNSASSGGAVYLYSAGPDFTNCSFKNNFATIAGAMYISYSGPVLSYCTFSSNDAEQGGGVYMKGYYEDCENNPCSTPYFINSVLAYNAGYNIFNSTELPGVPTLSYCDLYNPTSQENHNLSYLDASNLTVEPGFLTYDAEGLPSDFHLALSSQLVDVGAPSEYDADDSPADLGAYGGAYGNSWDLDLDGLPAYFWPGMIKDAPSGFNPAAFDCDDLDPEVHECL